MIKESSFCKISKLEVTVHLQVCFISDLRWNQVGLIGGRALLTSLDINKSLVKMELSGNNTPADIMKSIGGSSLVLCTVQPVHTGPCTNLNPV